jgi:hypothetical protein
LYASPALTLKISIFLSHSIGLFPYNTQNNENTLPYKYAAVCLFKDYELCSVLDKKPIDYEQFRDLPDPCRWGRNGFPETSVTDNQSTLYNNLSFTHDIFDFVFHVLPSCSVPKIVGSKFPRNVGKFYHTTRRHIQ